MALRREGMTLQQIGDLVGTTLERIRQLLERAGFDPKVGPEARKAAIEVQRERARWDYLPEPVQEFVLAARRDGYEVRTGAGSRPVLTVNGTPVRVHRGTPYQVDDRRYVRVTATDPDIIHLVLLPEPLTGWIRMYGISRTRRAHIIPLQPKRGRWSLLTPVDLAVPGATRALLEEESHGSGYGRESDSAADDDA